VSSKPTQENIYGIFYVIFFLSFAGVKESLACLCEGSDESLTDSIGCDGGIADSQLDVPSKKFILFLMEAFIFLWFVVRYILWKSS